MVKTIACRNAIGQILQMLVDDKQIPEDFMRFIDQCLSDYFYIIVQKKTNHFNGWMNFAYHLPEI